MKLFAGNSFTNLFCVSLFTARVALYASSGSAATPVPEKNSRPARWGIPKRSWQTRCATNW